MIYVQTDYGELEVRLSDPSAKVDVRVNGQTVTLDSEGKLTHIKPGPNQKLEITSADFETLAPLIEIYKKNIESAEPVGGYVNNNIMVTTDMMVLEDGARARQVSLNNRGNYHTALLLKYLDSFPISDGQPKWPDVPAPPSADQLEYAIKKGIIAVGSPDEAITSLKRYESIGADQLAFGTFATDVSLEDATEAYETFGKYVLPEFDKDPVHSTTRQREAQLGTRAPVAVS